MIKKNENPLAKEWEKRYSEQPADIKQKLDELYQINSKKYQLRVIKKTKVKLKEGDVFVLSPRENIYFYGKVLKTNIDHKEKDTFVHGKNVVFIFKNKTTVPSIDDFKPDYSQLLIRPAIVDISYWNKGFFYNVGNTGISDYEKNLDYGFYRIGIKSDWYCKEDGTVLETKPKILGLYGITTITGIARLVEKELIINPKLLKFD